MFVIQMIEKYVYCIYNRLGNRSPSEPKPDSQAIRNQLGANFAPNWEMAKWGEA